MIEDLVKNIELKELANGVPTESVESTQEAPVKMYKTVVISDVHLGSKWSATKEAARFIKKNSCETLILCGDIIDGWAIMRGGRRGMKWKRKHTNFVKALLDISLDTNVIYIRGNHDDFLDKIIPIELFNIKIQEDMVYESFGKRYYVAHGDAFDKVTSSMSWLSKIGDVGYSILLWYNKYYNRRRIRKGKPYQSIAAKIKQKVKASVSYISDYETHIADIAKAKKCEGVICGHIHHPEINKIGEVEYLNSGDWVESLSALIQDWDGNWSLFIHEKQQEHLAKMCEGKSKKKSETVEVTEQK